MEHQQILNMLQLLDDSNEEVFESIKPQIILLQQQAIPYLEAIEEASIDELVLERIAELKNIINTQVITQQLFDWQNEKDASIYVLLNILQQLHPTIHPTQELETMVKDIKKKIWLECNQYLTPLEHINIFFQIIFTQLHIKDPELHNQVTTINSCFLSNILERKSGDELLLVTFYKMYFDAFEIPVEIYRVAPQKYLCAYISTTADNEANIYCYFHPGFVEIYTYEELSNIPTIHAPTHLPIQKLAAEFLKNIALSAQKEKNAQLHFQAKQIIIQLDDHNTL